jgi:DNA-binding transcriptional LysR family regulator
MNRRHQFSSVPTEIMRSIVVIAEAGSISKAAKVLGVSQPAISAQIKRIEDHVGGSIFQKSAHGSAATELGRLVLTQARKILEANNQLLLLRGTRHEDRSLRVGMSDLYARKVFADMQTSDFADVSLVADASAEIVRRLLSGFIDIGLFLQLPGVPVDPAIAIVREREEEMVWVRSPKFVLSHGAPIPLLTWGGQVPYDLMIHALEKNGMIYRIAFASPDHQAHLEAAKLGIGLTALPKRLLDSSLVQAKEYYLPPLSSPKLFLAVRAGHDIGNHEFVDAFASSMLDSPPVEA